MDYSFIVHCPVSLCMHLHSLLGVSINIEFFHVMSSYKGKRKTAAMLVYNEIAASMLTFANRAIYL